MSPSLSLSSDEFSKNLCNGLSSLQRVINGQFVDMTLAADGHFVKVHQIVMALASPYIKEILSSIDSRHPVIFLNKISHGTLCLLLEYIYSGEVTISTECIKDFLTAAKELHIKGLDELATQNQETLHSTDEKQQQLLIYPNQTDTESHCYVEEAFNIANEGEQSDDNLMVKDSTDSNFIPMSDWKVLKPSPRTESKSPLKGPDGALIQYTVSNQGNLQIIVNRYLYCLKYKTKDCLRRWRCVDNPRYKCRAVVTTKNDMVVRRVGAHTHPFHDSRILKRINKGAVFSAIQEAEKESDTMKLKQPCSTVSS